jgi:hypothetical protein
MRKAASAAGPRVSLSLYLSLYDSMGAASASRALWPCRTTAPSLSVPSVPLLPPLLILKSEPFSTVDAHQESLPLTLSTS